MATGLVSMAAARLAFGAAQASCYPVLNKVSKNWFPLGMRTTAQGWIATFFGRAGGGAAFFLFGTVLVGWLHLPWRAAVGLFTLLGLAVGVAFLLLFRNTPREHPWANAAEAELVTAGDPEAAYATRARPPWRAMVRALRFGSSWFGVRQQPGRRALRLLAAAVPAHRQGLGENDAGWMAALPLMAGRWAAWSAAGCKVTFTAGRATAAGPRSGVGMAGKGLAAGLILLSLGVEPAAALACLFLIVKFFCDWEQPAEWGTISDIAGRSSATVFACVNTVGSLGGFVAGPLIGEVLQAYSDGDKPTAAGWNAVFVLIAGEYLVAAACWLFIDCRKAIHPVPGPFH